MVANSSSALRTVSLEMHSFEKEEASWKGLTTANASMSLEREAERDAYYNEFAPLVRRLIRKYGYDREMREDLEGEIYCRFCALLEAFDPTRGVPLRAYIVRQLSMATYTFARQQWRCKRREAAWDFEEGNAEARTAFDPTTDWLAAMSQEQVAALLPLALQQLPVRQRNVVIWRYFEERSYEEIADTMGVQPVSVRSLLRHGLNNLRKAVHGAGCLS